MDIGDAIIPIIIFIVWVVGQIAGKKNEEAEGQQNPMNRRAAPQQQPPPRPYNQPHSRQMPENESEADRTRRIQEEIRRKIAERRGQAPQPMPGGPPLIPQSAPPPVPVQQPAYEQRKPLNYGRPGEPPPPYQPQPVSYEPPPPPLRDYMAELAEQERILAVSEKRAADARLQAQAHMDRTYSQQASSPRRQKSYAGHAMASRIKGRLRDPQSTREAFLYMEILGTPVGQRQEGQMHPSWEG